jgi:phosphoribosyl 1,2-cyclic phosphodiesterase
MADTKLPHDISKNLAASIPKHKRVPYTLFTVDCFLGRFFSGYRSQTAASPSRTHTHHHRRQSASSCTVDGTAPTSQSLSLLSEGADKQLPHTHSQLPSAYFLSHFHSDHYGGLRSSFSRGPIFCSEVTASLVCDKLGVSRIWVHVLPIGEAVTIQGVEITLLDANHCAGAVMFLFRIPMSAGRYTTVLHCGDMRYTPAMREYEALKRHQVDLLYFDNTYANPRHRMPPQADMIQFIVDTVKTCMAKAKADSKRVLFLIGTYTIGKERIMIEVARQCNCKVYLPPWKYRLCKQLQVAGFDSLFTNDPADSNVHATGLFALDVHRLHQLFQIAHEPQPSSSNSNSNSNRSAQCHPGPTQEMQASWLASLAAAGDTAEEKLVFSVDKESYTELVESAHSDTATQVSSSSSPHVVSSSAEAEAEADAEAATRLGVVQRVRSSSSSISSYHGRKDPEVISKYWTSLLSLYDSVVAFRPTGWSFSQSKPISHDVRGSITSYKVPYSEHSSFPELRSWVEFIHPHKLIATVPSQKKQNTVKMLQRFSDLIQSPGASSILNFVKRSSSSQQSNGEVSSAKEAVPSSPFDSTANSGSRGDDKRIKRKRWHSTESGKKNSKDAVPQSQRISSFFKPHAVASGPGHGGRGCGAVAMQKPAPPIVIDLDSGSDCDCEPEPAQKRNCVS